MIPVRRTGLMTRAIEGEVIILDRAAGVVHQLNTTAGRIWACCDGMASARSIAEQLAADYEIAPDAAMRDVEGMLEKLQVLGLLDFGDTAVAPTGDGK
jgi:hypothetical protein